MKKISFIILLMLISIGCYSQNKEIEDTIINYWRMKFPKRILLDNRMCELKNKIDPNVIIVIGKWKFIDTISNRPADDPELGNIIGLHHSEVAFSVFQRNGKIKGYYNCEQHYDNKIQDYDIVENRDYYNNGKNQPLENYIEYISSVKHIPGKIRHLKSENEKCDIQIGNGMTLDEMFEKDINEHEDKTEKDSIINENNLKINQYNIQKHYADSIKHDNYLTDSINNFNNNKILYENKSISIKTKETINYPTYNKLNDWHSGSDVVSNKKDAAFLLSFICPGIGDMVVDKNPTLGILIGLSYISCLISGINYHNVANNYYNQYSTTITSQYQYDLLWNKTNQNNSISQKCFIGAGCIMFCDVMRIIVKNELNKTRVKNHNKQNNHF